MASLTATTSPSTGTVGVFLDRQLVADTFTRVAAAGWGNATPTGGAWTTSGGAAADYSVNGTQGLMSLTSTNVSRRALIGSGLTDVDWTFDFTVPVNPSGTAIDVGATVRHTGTTYYMARVRLNPGGPATLSLRYVIVGTLYPMSAEVTIPDFTITASNALSVRIQAEGPFIRARAWATAAPEPTATWMVATSNSELTSGSVGMYAFRLTGNLNGTFAPTFDNAYALASVEPLNLYRVTPDGVSTLVRGSGFYTVDPVGTATLWDSEAPFDVNIFYTLASSQSTTVTVTSNTVNLASSGDVWLRDPVNPSLNLLIDIDSTPFDYCVATQRIMFADLTGKEYASASGIFELIDAERPQTISQRRKRYGASLILHSKEAADVEDIEAILASGRPLLLSLPTVYQFGLPYGTDWITISDVTATPSGVDRRTAMRTWVLPFRLSLPSADVNTGGTGGNGIGGGDATYDMLRTSVLGTTYNTLTAAATTYDAIAAGTGY